MAKAKASYPVLLVLCLQAFLLFYRLDLLPAWGDEIFTLLTVAHPASEIPGIVERDIHPPLYYLLLHGWAQLRLPWTGLEALRAFSGLAALAATFLFDWLWARRWKTGRRWVALALFAFAPSLLLYGRMARSYALQTALGLLAISLLWRWMLQPQWGRFVAALAALTALLYTHYLPGIAVLIGFTLLAWRRIGFGRVAMFDAACLIAYAPWLIALTTAFRHWGEAGAFQSHYALAGSLVLEQGLKIAFAILSLTIGETFFPISLVLAPVMVFVIGWGCRKGRRNRLPHLLAAIAVIAYIGASGG